LHPPREGGRRGGIPRRRAAALIAYFDTSALLKLVLDERGPTLQAGDAVHLASALAAGADDAVLVTWDDDLGRAARAEGLAIVP
jgi:hypothetical protein